MPKIICNGQEVNGINNNKDVLDKIAEVESKVDTNTTNISTLQTDVSANSEAISEIPKMKIQRGVVTANVTETNWKVFDVVFDTPYKEVPFVNVNWWFTISSNNFFINGITKTGFQFYAHITTINQDINMYWQAIGEVE